MPSSYKQAALAALYGALCADAYALGAHWVYDTDAIAGADLDWSGYNAPMTGYHGSRVPGDFTHYGDQALWLLESLALEGEFALAAFARRWQAYTELYKGYVDAASKATLAALHAGKDCLHCGSSSQDMSIVGRIAPLLYRYSDDKDALLKNVHLHTRFTHATSQAETAARYFAEVAYALLQGEALENVLAETAKNYDAKLQQWVKVGMRSTGFETTEAIKSFGQSCSVNAAFSGVIHLVCKYRGDYVQAMYENVKAGGDSAARGMVAGMLLGAAGAEVPQAWRENLTHYEQIEQLIGIIDG